MLNPNQKLNSKLFDSGVEQAPIRKGFGEGLLAAGEADERVVGLCADLTESTQMHLFKNKFPNRFIEIGVAEQNLATVASGMAAMGKIPFITSYAMFSPGRNWEQIRTTICYNDRPVKIAGSHAGISVGPDGGTHQAVEDIAIMRVMPRMVVISPCDAIEAKKATIAAAKTNTPVYIRLAREKTPIITTLDTPFEIGKAEVFYSSRFDLKSEERLNLGSVGIIATGALLYKALKVARELEKEKIGVTVLNIATIKPLDEKAIVKLAKETKALVTVEEHQIHGGLGSAVAEALAREYPVPVEFIGVRDLFGQSGSPEQLLEHYGMGEKHIYDAVRKVLKRKA
ncbi:MAG: transketolase [Candidatus Taylorbacteria bacterium RIFCSPHIGHO2_01_FULL_45_63]|uniref:Transketolase n=1 Tax=Candidatus Taylorbacteria bacterium RIFCSPHIGHO2_02_FULL_45_35 TaxID=1802311 RepID=A0A1G2MQ55_9BACT|nr:MAG: transketolase [Candidatus Taylorbacteria bacterium RIFCSPHIGHO2_01_FULL_45_63]OHA25874.1 MAG: transketolase [Candidatus Taylorbacteria bacterium RIFCSPHIGHO2_02_FULL_45_35]OHA32364.1 MAG: transketolase [Candidatus Taylorbacteria bacterium RIFCSPLOWO2_01_FULL_45_34b]